MQLKHGNPLELRCKDGEVITVNVQARGTVHSVAYSLYDQVGSLPEGPFQFTVDSAKSNPTVLRMLFRYSLPRGGAYAVQVRGSNEDTSEYFIKQLPGQLLDSVAYQFEVPEAPKTHFVQHRGFDIFIEGGQEGTKIAGQEGTKIAGQEGSKIAGQEGTKIAGQEGTRTTAQRGKEVDEARFVNINFAALSDKRLIPRTAALELEQSYYLRLNIGPLSKDTAVRYPGPFPANLLPSVEGGHWLEAVVVSDDFTLQRHRYNFFLPLKGASWVCACKQLLHTCDAEKRRDHLYIWVRPKKVTSEARMRIGIYYQNNLIQSQLLTTEIAPAEHKGKGYSSTIDYTLTASLDNLASFSPRVLNILTNENNDGTHKIIINGALDDAVTFNLTEGKVGNAIGAVRQKLLELHVRIFGGQLGSKPQYENLFDDNNTKSKDDFIADLRAFAPCGRLLWETLLTDQPEQRHKLRTELLRNPATIQVSRIHGSNFVFPWAVIYDIPLESDSQRHRTCRLLDEWTKASALIDPEQPDCPYRDEHQKNTICPFGFWGFRHVIEQPPSMPPGRNLQRTIKVANSPIEFLAALSLDLDQSLTKSHLDALASKLARIMNVVPHRSRQDIEAGLANPKLEIVYFYCHGERQLTPGSNTPVPFLAIGDQEKLTTGDLITWSDSDWDAQHWQDTSPLVFINGCHTAELTPQVLVNFVDAFAGVNAAGVIGTEIMLHQQVANEAAQIFFDYFKNPKCSVGQALQQVRRSLLLKGNLLGLAYTPYCSTDLQLT